MRVFCSLLVLMALQGCLATIADPRVKVVLSTLPPRIVTGLLSRATTPICGGFWQANGYYCSPAATIQYNKDDVAAFDRYTQEFLSSADMLHGIALFESRFIN